MILNRFKQINGNEKHDTISSTSIIENLQNTSMLLKESTALKSAKEKPQEMSLKDTKFDHQQNQKYYFFPCY